MAAKKATLKQKQVRDRELYEAKALKASRTHLARQKLDLLQRQREDKMAYSSSEESSQ